MLQRSCLMFDSCAAILARIFVFCLGGVGKGPRVTEEFGISVQTISLGMATAGMFRRVEVARRECSELLQVMQ